MSIATPASKARCITRLSYPVPFVKPQKTSLLAFQRRHYADEPTSQSEPEAFGATEAEHGENSIAASEDSGADANASTPIEHAEEEHAEERTPESKLDSAADSVRSATQSVTESVTGAAQGLSSAAGFGSPKSEAGTAPPSEETSTTVYVGNLFFDVRSEDLEKEFAKAGPVVSAKIIMDARGLSKGFVIFLIPIYEFLRVP